MHHFPWKELKYLWWLPVYLISYLLLERLTASGYWSTQLWLDDCIPFCEWFVFPYCLWYPLLAAVGIFLLLRDQEGFRRYMDLLALTFFASVIIWLLVPNGQDLRPVFMHRDNLPSRMVAFLYSLDTNTNVFPSVHVVGSVGAAWAVWETPALREHRLIRRAVVLLAALICLSTLFIKQHTVLDVASGLALSFASGAFVYTCRPPRRVPLSGHW